MSVEEESLTVAARRIKRIVDVISLISLGEFDPTMTTLETPDPPDAFAFVEESLNVLARELAETRVENDAHVAQLNQAQVDMAEKLATIERQQLAIRDLSTPIIELWDDILTLPIIGIVDTERSVEMTAKLLQRIAERQVRCVIIDVTGVDVVDTATADHFVQMIKSAKLLGVYCVVTGMSPEIAQTLVRIGVDLGAVSTLRTLKDGLKDCFLHLRRADEEEAHNMARR